MAVVVRIGGSAVVRADLRKLTGDLGAIVAPKVPQTGKWWGSGVVPGTATNEPGDRLGGGLTPTSARGELSVCAS